MKKIIALFFLLSIPFFMAAQTFKITGVKGIGKSTESVKKKEKKLTGMKMTLSNPYPNIISLNNIKLVVGEDYEGIILSAAEGYDELYTKKVDESTIYVLKLNKIYGETSSAELTTINLKDDTRWIYSMNLY